jgi:Methyltransferase domain
MKSLIARAKDKLRPFYFRGVILPRLHRSYRKLNLAEAFQRVYASQAWGSAEQFDSGLGSIGNVADEYCRFVGDFIRCHNVKTVADLGCGDFRIGQRIMSESGVDYVGVDIVPELIERNRKQFPGVRFECLNLLTDNLPAADLCLIRQVFQHLSNAEIQSALRNISHYPMALISEHVPAFPKSLNRDKPHGPDIRAFWGSGVYLEHPPFSYPIDKSWEVPIRGIPGLRDEILRTVLISSRGNSAG